MKTIYICDLCGMQFTDWNECLNHELKWHIKPRVIEKADHYDGDYPEYLQVRMDNGALVLYILDRVIEPPKKEDSAEGVEEVA